MSTQSLQQMQWARREGGGVPKWGGGVGSPEKFLEAASQTYKRLAAVQQNSSTKKIEACADGALTAPFLGLAGKAASGVTDTESPVLCITEDDVWIMNVYHSTLGSAISARSQQGARYGIKVSSGNIYVDLEVPDDGSIESTTACKAWVKVLGFVDPIGDTYGRVYVKFGRRGIATDGSPQVDFLQNP